MTTSLSTLLFCALALFSLLSLPANAGEALGGREFYFGIPHVKKPLTEGARGLPTQVWISSATDNTVTIEAPAIGFAQTHNVKAGKVHIIAIPNGLMNSESEKVNRLGIHLRSSDPITATCYISYKVSGEAFALRPVATLGTEYHVLSLWQDHTDDYKPGQILLVGTQDNTQVSYRPSAATDTVEKGAVKTITLNAGETYLIHSKVEPAYNQEPVTDLTGTEITADKPIAVFSGHTKGAFPRFSSMMLGTPANFMRNLLIEQMPPLQSLGTEHVIAPVVYAARPSNGQDPYSEGDLLRFVATRDHTTLYINSTNGTEPTVLRQNMRKGEVYEVEEFTEAAVFTSNSPVLVGHYGKAWRLTVVPSSADKREQPANPARTGSGMMLTVTPTSRWVSYALYRSPEGMNNFLNIVFRTQDSSALRFNGKPFPLVFGPKIQQIPGTPYSYVSTISQPGENSITVDPGTPNITFSAYAYGNYDATKDGFAYGYPVGTLYATSDTRATLNITTTAEPSCGTFHGTATINNYVNTNHGIGDVYLSAVQSNNYALTHNPFIPGGRDVDFTLSVVDPGQDAVATVVVQTRDGRDTSLTYRYTASKVVASVEQVEFGTVAVGGDSCRTVTLTNPLDHPVTVASITLKNQSATFSLGLPTLPLLLAPGASTAITVCSHPESAGTFSDSIAVATECGVLPRLPVTVQAQELVITMTDCTFGQVVVGSERTLEVRISNLSAAGIPVVLDTVDWPQTEVFQTSGLLDQLPITLLSNGSFTFTVTYRPPTTGTHTATATFAGNVTGHKLHSTWNGVGVNATSVGTPDEQQPALSVVPHPVTESSTVRYTLHSPAHVSVSLYALTGERVLHIEESGRSAGEHTLRLDTRHLPQGVYMLRFDTGEHSRRQTLIVR